MVVFLAWHFFLTCSSATGHSWKEKKKRSHTLQMQLLPNQVLSMADERGERVGKENIREVQIR